MPGSPAPLKFGKLQATVWERKSWISPTRMRVCLVAESKNIIRLCDWRRRQSTLKLPGAAGKSDPGFEICARTSCVATAAGLSLGLDHETGRLSRSPTKMKRQSA
jgi:hypothetical protein